MENPDTTDHRLIDLPSFPSPFIGRTYHLQSIAALLRDEGKRLITLLGPGGMGKTRLAVRIGEMMIDDFEHGVCFVALDTVTDPGQVPLYIGHRLKLRVGSTGNWMEAIIGFLRDKQLLLILDNLEQILDAAPDIARILEACPRVTVLTTSREILDLPQELEYPLDSLNRPNPKLFPNPEELMRFDAIDLFVQKARSSRPDFQITETNAAAVVEICQLLDGLPLPIELAAARIKLFSPELILKKLQSNSDLLKTRARGVIPRHQNIRQTIQWSYDLLDENEQQLFQQLAIFSSGFTPGALEKTCTAADALEVIESFLNKSLIVKDREVHQLPRFRMLKLIRDYGREQLALNPDREVYYRRFAEYYIGFMEESSAQLRTAAPNEWIALVEAEYENLESALAWLTANCPDGAARLGAGFWRFHLSRGFFREGLNMIQQLIALPIADSTLTVPLLEAAGTLSHNLGAHLEARGFLLRCLEQRRAGENKTSIVKTLNNLAWVEWRLGEYDQALDYSRKGLDIARKGRDLPQKATSLNNIAWVAFYRGLYEQAEDLQRKVLEIRTQLKDRSGMAFAQINLARALIKTGKFLEAESMLKAGMETYENLKNQQLLTFARMMKAKYHLAKRDRATGKRLLRDQCLPEFEKIGDIWGLAHCHSWIGRIFFWEEELQAARVHLSRAMELFRHSHDKYGQAHSSFWWSRLCWESEGPDAAGEALQRSLTLAAEMKANDLLRDGYLEQARRAVRRKDFVAGLRHLAIADHYAEKLGSYQYGQFSTELTPLLEPLRAFLASKNTSLKEIMADSSQEIDAPFQRASLRVEQLGDRLQRLLPPTSPDSSTAIRAEKEEEKGQEAGTATVSGTQDPFVLRVRKVVEAHLQNPKLSVKSLCGELNVSHSQLHRKLRAATGLSTSQFIRSVRLEKARELLRDPELTIAAVAYDSGFRDVDYFYRVFKQETGMTPGAFREGQI